MPIDTELGPELTDEEFEHLTGEQAYRLCVANRPVEERDGLMIMIIAGVSPEWIANHDHDQLPRNVKRMWIKGLEHYRTLIFSGQVAAPKN